VRGQVLPVASTTKLKTASVCHGTAATRLALANVTRVIYSRPMAARICCKLNTRTDWFLMLAGMEICATHRPTRIEKQAVCFVLYALETSIGTTP
jgi:hypothetical protein